MNLCKYKVRDKHCQGIQAPLNCIELSFIDVDFAVFLISNVNSKLLLVVLTTHKKVNHMLFDDASVLCSEIESTSVFQKRLATSQQWSHFSRLQYVTGDWLLASSFFCESVWQWALNDTVGGLQWDSLLDTPTSIGVIFSSPDYKTW